MPAEYVDALLGGVQVHPHVTAGRDPCERQPGVHGADRATDERRTRETGAVLSRRGLAVRRTKVASRSAR